MKDDGKILEDILDAISIYIGRYDNKYEIYIRLFIIKIKLKNIRINRFNIDLFSLYLDIF